MKTIGLAVEVHDSRPVLTVAVVDDRDGAAEVVGWFELTSTGEDLASQLHTLSASVVTRVKDLLPAELAVVRRADAQPRGVGATEAVKLRLIAEGAVIAAVRERLPDVRVGAGVELARWCGTDKASMDSDALSLVMSADLSSRVGVRKRIAQAVAAAVAGLSA